MFSEGQADWRVQQPIKWEGRGKKNLCLSSLEISCILGLFQRDSMPVCLILKVCMIRSTRPIKAQWPESARQKSGPLDGFGNCQGGHKF